MVGSTHHLEDIFNLISPLLVLMVLIFIVLFCSLVMVTDYLVKKARYTKWKARPESNLNSPEHCSTYTAQGPYNSLSTISEYIPLCAESRESEIQVDNQIVTPVKRRRRRRLLRRRETLSDWCINKRTETRKSSLPARISLSRSISSRDSVDSPRQPVSLPLTKPRPSSTRSRSIRSAQESVRDSASTISGPGQELDRSGSEMTLRPAASVSGFSCTSNEQELEYDLYDCDLGNAMAAPGSMFAPAYWDCDVTPTLDLELTELFPAEGVEVVEMREAGRRGPHMTSITSDLTSSMSSAVSRSTLVGEVEGVDDGANLEGGAEEEGEEEPGEESKLLGGLDTSGYYSGGEDTEVDTPSTKTRLLLNSSHALGISFVDD